MAYTRIRLNFQTMRAAYKHNKQLPIDIGKWLKDQNDREDIINKTNSERAARGEKPLPGGGHSTSCCMQVSLSFNATGQPIPSAGSRDRGNTPLNGKYYILAVDEFRAYLTYKYGPTDVVSDSSTRASIKGKNGVLIFGNGHIEFWDGDDILQKSGTAGMMNPVLVWSQKPIWFWEIGEDAPTASALVPEWAQGWWTVYDGNYYYYYFSHDGTVNFIQTKPNPKWKPPQTIGNQGKVTLIPNGLSILWKPTEPGGEATKEDFTRLNWTSTTEMNGKSNKYSPLFARKM